jgi:NADH:ubiquinone oxidoreductase subunit 6 (subunit J)
MNGLQVVGYIVGLAIFVYMCVEVWRSPMTTGSKVGWTIFAFFCTLIALIVWLVTGKRRAYGSA